MKAFIDGNIHETSVKTEEDKRAFCFKYAANRFAHDLDAIETIVQFEDEPDDYGWEVRLSRYSGSTEGPVLTSKMSITIEHKMLF